MSISRPNQYIFLGDHTQNYWDGSSTLFLQNKIPALISTKSHKTVILYTPDGRKNLFFRYFAPLRRKKNDKFIQCAGGLVWILLVLFCKKGDIVHALVLRSFMGPLLRVAAFRGAKVFLSIHDTLFIENTASISYRVISAMSKIAHSVFVFCQKDYMIMTQHFPHLRVIETVHGIETVTDSNKINSNSIIVFGGGVGSPVKGLDFLERALSRVNVPHQLQVYGEQKSFQKNKYYRGSVSRSDFSKIVSHCRMIVVTSRYESFSLTALEAISLGIPVVVTRTAGIASHLTDGKDALLVDYDDDATLAASIERLLVDDILWDKLSRMSRQTAAKFHWDNILPVYLQAYSDMQE